MGNFVSQFGFPWKYQIVEIVRFVRMSKMASDYGVTEVPSKFLLGPDLEIILVNPDLPEIRKLLNDNKQGTQF